MREDSKSTRLYFTAAARAASVATKQKNKDSAIPFDAPAIFVTRLTPQHKTFVWEIRKFGSFVLHRSSEEFDTAAEARSAGQAALTKME